MAESRTLSLSRDLFVPRELVFDVWTQPEHLAQWYAPGPDFERSAEVDLHEGGAYALSWTGPDGAKQVQRGEFATIKAPERLLYSADRQSGRPTEIDVRFNDLGGGTRIELHEVGYLTARDIDSATAAWQLLLDQLEGYFSVI